MNTTLGPGMIVAIAGSFALLSCDTTSFNQPLHGGYDPLDSPGRRPVAEQNEHFTKGTWVTVSDPNAGFFRKFPTGEEQPDSPLAMGTPLKVVGSQGTYAKVETESGLIGFVPAIMVSEGSSGGPAAPDSLPGGPDIVPLPIDPDPNLGGPTIEPDGPVPGLERLPDPVPIPDPDPEPDPDLVDPVDPLDPQ